MLNLYTTNYIKQKNMNIVKLNYLNSLIGIFNFNYLDNESIKEIKKMGYPKTKIIQDIKFMLKIIENEKHSENKIGTVHKMFNYLTNYKYTLLFIDNETYFRRTILKKLLENPFIWFVVLSNSLPT